MLKGIFAYDLWDDNQVRGNKQSIMFPMPERRNGSSPPPPPLWGPVHDTTVPLAAALEP